ncbi:hypothetical protein [Sanguibacter antarcticus]|uniref:Uncharacterized protein n=1 Tax=Sanguibacter antarcticus TaxID=372484 RepID=A0A2A9E7K3_9MICO|nr:hypothetical protein [Sanguibacter antarcticus]PFG34844.1 hypothetical protein ATL42_2772 [Sanguibacter antarcticus]
MGKTPTIKDLEKSESAFRDYIHSLEDQLSTKASDVQSKVDAEITAFYKDSGYTDAKNITSGLNYDFMQEQSFSMDNLKGIIDAISQAVFTGGKPPAGATVDKDGVSTAKAELGPTIGEMANLELYIAGQVFNVLSSIMLSFGTSSALTFKTNMQNKPLGYGMQLFAAVSSESYQSTSFFHNEYIYEYLYIYSVKFSVQQAQSEVKQQLVRLYSDQITVFKQRELDLLDQLSAGKITPEAYTTANAVFDTLIAAVEKKIGDLKAVALQAALNSAKVR